MNLYLVGGAVRDKLLNYPFTEHDWVVVGATPKELLDQGFVQIGSDFPVFLHPETKEEYALARTERKSGNGYKGFKFFTDTQVTLEEDLSRRDLTINAIAEDCDGNIIDPYGGLNDLSDKILRHVSNAFSEDPLRVLRVARFAARYHHLGFKIADETLLLMTLISDSGELQYLSTERVWTETVKALKEKSPRIYIEVLRKCNALSKLFPEIEQLFKSSQKNSKMNAGIRTLISLDYVAKLDKDPSTRFAVLMGNISKEDCSDDTLSAGSDPKDDNVKIINGFCDRLKIPNRYRSVSVALIKYRDSCHNSRNLNPPLVIKMLKDIGAFKNPSNLIQFITCCHADVQRTKKSDHKFYDSGVWLKKVFNEMQLIDNKKIMVEGFEGIRLGQEIDKRRQKIIIELSKK